MDAIGAEVRRREKWKCGTAGGKPEPPGAAARAAPPIVKAHAT